MGDVSVTSQVADRIKNLRRERRWSARQLADACAREGRASLTRSTIAKIESGARKSITADEVAVLARALDVTPTDLIASDSSVTVTDKRTSTPDITSSFGGASGGVKFVHEKHLVRPAQLPTDIPDFIGREAEFASMEAALDFQRSGYGTAIATIQGMPGVGKTALATRWAHMLADRFPDGQLFLALRGYSSQAPMSPGELLTRALRALDVSESNIPDDEALAAALYRSLLADRHMLIVLDDAASSEQVRPLLPGNKHSAVVITSRNRLAGLVAREGAQNIQLDVLHPNEAKELLRRILGAKRTEAEPHAVEELVRRCAYLPLAIRVAAAWLAMRPQWSIVELVQEMSEGDRLSVLGVDEDPVSTVRTAFSHSYFGLPDEMRLAFRRLGLIDGPSFTPQLVGAALETTTAEARSLLHSLDQANLIESIAPDSYRLHDLLREYARERAWVEDSEHEREAAIRRVSEFREYPGSQVAIIRRHGLQALEKLDRPLYRAQHCLIFAAQNLNKIDAGRHNSGMELERDNMRELLKTAFDESGLRWDLCRHEKRASVSVVVIPAMVPSISMIDPLFNRLVLRLRQHNQRVGSAAKLRIRVAVHIGEIHEDKQGLAGKAISHLLHLLDACASRDAESIEDEPADISLIASDYFHDSVIRDGADPGKTLAFDPAALSSTKPSRTLVRAWIYRPSDEYNDVDQPLSLASQDPASTRSVLSFWKSLTATEQGVLQSAGQERVFSPGAVLCREGAPADHVIVIRSGWTKICVERDDRERIIAMRGPGDLIGERAVLLSRSRSATVIALDSVRALLVTTEEFNSVLAKHPRILEVLEEQIYSRLTEPHARPTAQGLTNLDRQLASLLLEFVQRHRSGEDSEIAPPLPLSSHDLAALLDAPQSKVVQTMTNWQQRRVIHIRSGSIRVLDSGILSKISEGTDDWSTSTIPEPHQPNCSILITDITAFGARTRSDEDRRSLRRAMYNILRDAFEHSELSWPDCYVEDRGDGNLILIPPGVSTASVVDPLITHLAVGLQRHNRSVSGSIRIQLRVALHVGKVITDSHGVFGSEIANTARLLDSSVLKKRLAETGANLGFIISKYVFESVVRRGSDFVDPTSYEKVRSEGKGTKIDAWMHLVGLPHES